MWQSDWWPGKIAIMSLGGYCGRQRNSPTHNKPCYWSDSQKEAKCAYFPTHQIILSSPKLQLKAQLWRPARERHHNVYYQVRDIEQHLHLNIFETQWINLQRAYIHAFMAVSIHRIKRSKVFFNGMINELQNQGGGIGGAHLCRGVWHAPSVRLMMSSTWSKEDSISLTTSVAPWMQAKWSGVDLSFWTAINTDAVWAMNKHI